MRKFKTRKKFNRLIIYLGLFLVSIALTIKYLYSNDLINNNTIIDLLLSEGISKNEKITDVDFLLKYALNIKLEESKPASKEEVEIIPPTNIEIPKEENLEKIVYLYNTHQEEKYESPYLGAYNIATGVLLASKMLKEYLENEGIGVYVEEENTTDMIHSLSLKYSDSYSVSRMLLERRKQEVNTLKYFIDLHRDSSKYEKTTATIDGKSYAKVLLVVGLEHDNYEINLEKANKLADLIKDFSPDLFRGITKKSGAGVNGIYNQDFDQNTLLIEVGGQYNNITEVDNTLKALAKILAQFIKEDENG